MFGDWTNPAGEEDSDNPNSKYRIVYKIIVEGILGEYRERPGIFRRQTHDIGRTSDTQIRDDDTYRPAQPETAWLLIEIQRFDTISEVYFSSSAADQITWLFRVFPSAHPLKRSHCSERRLADAFIARSERN
jgi:hypothetical protein